MTGSDPHSRLVVVCKGDARLMTLDAESLAVVGAVALTDIGHEVTVDPARTRAFVPLFGSGGVGSPGRSGDGIDVIDLASGSRLDTIALPAGARPHDAGWGADGLLYVTAEGLSAILAVDPATGRVEGTHPTGHPQSHMLAVTRDGSRAYTANVRPGSLTEVDLTGRRRPRTLRLAPHVNRLSLSPDESEAYVADQSQARLAIVALSEMRVRRWVALPGVAFGTVPTQDGRQLVLALRESARLALLDLHTETVVAATPVPGGPQRTTLDELGRTAYTACSPANVVVAVDLASMSVIAQGRPGPDPDGLALAGDDVTTLGRAKAVVSRHR